MASDLLTKVIFLLVGLTVAGYMFGPAIQGWATANTNTCLPGQAFNCNSTYRNVTNPSVSWANTTVIPIMIGIVILIISFYAVKKK